jgi:hypothetical protein
MQRLTVMFVMLGLLLGLGTPMRSASARTVRKLCLRLSTPVKAENLVRFRWCARRSA